MPVDRPLDRYLIVNRGAKVLHLSVNGKTYESCNLDAVIRANRRTAPLDTMSAYIERGYRQCKRCFHLTAA
jgi:hypothetical protein